MTNAEILLMIDRLGQIQSANPPTSRTWQLASEALAPLFAEMAKRKPVTP